MVLGPIIRNAFDDMSTPRLDSPQWHVNATICSSCLYDAVYRADRNQHIISYALETSPMSHCFKLVNLTAFTLCALFFSFNLINNAPKNPLATWRPSFFSWQSSLVTIGGWCQYSLLQPNQLKTKYYITCPDISRWLHMHYYLYLNNPVFNKDFND